MIQLSDKEFQRIMKLNRYIATAKAVLAIVFVTMLILAASK